MILLVYALVFGAAAGVSWITLSRRIDETLGGVVATVLWLRLVPASFALKSVSGGAVVSLPTDAPTAIVVATLAILMGTFALGSVLDRLPDREATRFADT